MMLEGKTALITGGSGGMGFADAKLFAAEGASVVIADIADDKGRKAVEELEGIGAKAIYLHLDVSNETDWINARRAVENEFGALHILVNNAGINKCTMIPMETVEEWNRIYAINVLGPMLGIKHFCTLMRDSGGGSIINIASTAGTNAHFLAAYSSSKWALRGLSKDAALTFGKWNIRSNVICPGLINTQLGNGLPPQAQQAFIKANAIERMGEPEEIAQAVLFLASDLSSFITGDEICVDGGFNGTSSYGSLLSMSGMLDRLLEQIK